MTRFVLAGFVVLLLWIAPPVAAHCDALDGPVVRDARVALDTRGVDGVLKWVAPEGEDEVRRVFAQVLRVRADGDAARELADRYFFETLVRLHRASEGEGFAGLKPAGAIPPAVADVDEALERGDARRLARRLSREVESAVLARFEEARRHRRPTVADGRRYVASYVELVHFVEAVHRLLEEGAGHRHEDDPAHAAE